VGDTEAQVDGLGFKGLKVSTAEGVGVTAAEALGWRTDAVGMRDKELSGVGEEIGVALPG
jgi:hypothetical protein